MAELPFQELSEADRKQLFSPKSRTVKRQLIKKGYTWQLSIYGVQKTHENNEREYRRIEVLSNIIYTEKIVHQIYYYFENFIPSAKYTIWTYTGETDNLEQEGAFN